MKIYDLEEPRKLNVLVPHMDDGSPLLFHTIKEDKWLEGYWNNGVFFADNGWTFSTDEIDKVIVL